MARFWGIVGTSVAVLAFSGWGWIVYHSRDLASVEETGLRLHGRLLPSHENAAVPLREAASQVHWPGSEDARHRVRALRTFSSWDGELARDLVDRNEAALDGFEQAMRLPQIEISAAELSPPTADGEVAAFVLWLRLVEVRNVRAALRMVDGDSNGAFEDALAGLRLADRIHRSRGASLIHAGLGLALGEMALSQLRALLPRARVDRAAARQMIAAIERARGDGESWARIWAGEYREMRDMYAAELRNQADSSRWGPSSYVLHYNRTLQRLADLYKGLQRNSRVVCDQMEVLTPPQPPAGLERVKLVLAPNSIGNILVEIAGPELGFQRKRCAFASHASAVQAAVALKAHLNANGALPESLDELVPELLDAVPRDGFRGEPLRYSRAEGTLYLPDEPEPWRLPF